MLAFYGHNKGAGMLFLDRDSDFRAEDIDPERWKAVATFQKLQAFNRELVSSPLLSRPYLVTVPSIL